MYWYPHPAQTYKNNVTPLTVRSTITTLRSISISQIDKDAISCSIATSLTLRDEMSGSELTRISATVGNPEQIHVNANGEVRSRRFCQRGTEAHLLSDTTRLRAAIQKIAINVGNRRQSSKLNPNFVRQQCSVTCLSRVSAFRHSDCLAWDLPVSRSLCMPKDVT